MFINPRRNPDESGLRPFFSAMRVTQGCQSATLGWN